MARIGMGWRWALGGAGALVLLLLAAAATIDPSPFRGTLERRLSARLGRPVTIARLAREGGPSLTPTIAIEGLAVGAPAGLPPLARIDRVRFRLPLLPLLVGAARPRDVAIDGGRLNLRREADGRDNWTFGKAGGGSHGGTPLAGIRVRDLHASLDDRRRDRTADVTLAASPEDGLRLAGRGTIRGSAVAIAARMTRHGAFAGHVAGPTLDARIAGRSDRPWQLGSFTARMAARGDDLRTLDALAEAGLPGTQPFRLAAQLRHLPDEWRVTGIAGTIGRSQVDGSVVVHKQDGRSRVDGDLHAARLDFEDIASDEGLARAAAKRRRDGPRVVPDTRIALDHLQRTDGHLAFRIDRLLWRTPAPFARMRGAFALSHGVLRLEGLVVGLDAGTITGIATVRQQGMVPTRLALDLRLRGGRLEDFAGRGHVAAPLEGRVRLDGVGPTVRAAVGTATGHIALVARSGEVDRRAAELIGRNVGRALVAGAGEKVALRCLIADFRGRGGRFTPQPFLVDTAVARADGRGSLAMADERIALTLDGGSKVPAAFRLSGPLLVSGTLKQPIVKPTPAATAPGGILKTIGHALGGGPKEAAAHDADCAGLAARALH